MELDELHRVESRALWGWGWVVDVGGGGGGDGEGPSRFINDEDNVYVDHNDYCYSDYNYRLILIVLTIVIVEEPKMLRTKKKPLHPAMA